MERSVAVQDRRTCERRAEYETGDASLARETG
jgi:hypothetical protein